MNIFWKHHAANGTSIVCLMFFVPISTIRYLFFIARCENMFHNREVRKNQVTEVRR
ncbi:hypothetical protein EfmE1679_1077 [Enterococcus faecium E1679]|nr:hypothetical protein EfmE1679_1077 [Enterococcus faecium E1679]MBK4851310.1 hypothetical protein [Enterococcus faecium]